MAQLDKRALDNFINANVVALTSKFVVDDREGGLALEGVTRADADRALQELHGRLGKVWKPFFAPARRKLLAGNFRLIGATFVRASGATAESAGRAAGADGDAALEVRVRDLESKLPAVKARRATLRKLVGMADRLDRTPSLSRWRCPAPGLPKLCRNRASRLSSCTRGWASLMRGSCAPLYQDVTVLAAHKRTAQYQHVDRALGLPACLPRWLRPLHPTDLAANTSYKTASRIRHSLRTGTESRMT
jgi:hypothetical protein